MIWIYKIYSLIPEGCTVRRLNRTSVQGMKRSCPGEQCYMSLSVGNILWYRSKPITATLSHLSQGTSMRFTLPLWASLVSISAQMMGKHGSTFSHKFPICCCHQSQNWSSAADLIWPSFLLIQSQPASFFWGGGNRKSTFFSLFISLYRCVFWYKLVCVFKDGSI